jgi:tetratricopeptide (TPR) repeat protein
MAAEAGVRLLAGGADSLERASSYYAWRRVFTDALGLSADGDEAERHAAFLRAIERGSEIARLAPVLNPVLELNLAENEVTSQMTSQSRAEAATALLVEILQQLAAETPLAIVIEDAHWLDSASWALALDLHRKAPGLLLVLATRPLEAPEPEPWKALRQAAAGAYIALGPLPESDVIALVCKRLNIDALPAPAAELIMEKAEGHPLFSEELGYTLRDAGHLVIRARHCELAPSAGNLRRLHFPTSVQGVVSERIDRLSARDRLAIKVASVNGRTFSLPMLCAIHPVEADRPLLAACVQRLVDFDLVTPPDAGGESVFQFKHNIIQEVAYQQLVFDQRRQLHRRLAEILEKSEPGNFPILAHHWRHAGVLEKAVPYFDLAGDEAAKRYANREVIDFFEQAIQLRKTIPGTPDATRSGHRHRQIGEAHYRLGRLEEGRRWLSDATAILGHPMPAPRRMKMLALPGAALRQMIHRLRRGSTPDSPPADGGPLLETIQIYNLLGEIAFFKNDLPTSVFCTIHGANLAESLGPSDKLTEMRGSVMIVAAAMPPLALGRYYHALTARALRSVRHPMPQAFVEELMGMYFAGLGHLDHARALLEKADATFRRFGNSRRSEECLVNLGYIHFHRGDFAQYRATCAQLLHSADSREDSQSRGWARTQRSMLLLATAGPAAAVAELDRQDFLIGDPLTRAGFDAVSAVAHFRLDGVETARAHAERALALFGSGPPVCYTMAIFISLMAEAFLGFLERAQRDGTPTRDIAAQARRSCGTMQKFARVFPVARPRAALWAGLEHWLHGRKRTAERLWQRARADAEGQGMAFELALVHAQLARIHGEPGRAQAVALFEKLGAHSELAHWFPVP